MNIFLVRHGEAAASWSESPDPGLSSLGWQQAREAAEFLVPLMTLDTQLLSSPLLRAKQTAEPLADQLGRTVEDSAIFREIPAPVELARRQAWLRQFMQQEWQDQSESLGEWRAAAIQYLLTLTQPAVVFTHFLVINAVVGHVLKQEKTLCFWPANGSVTRLRRRGSELELIELGRAMKSVVN